VKVWRSANAVDSQMTSNLLRANAATPILELSHSSASNYHSSLNLGRRIIRHSKPITTFNPHP
jgi:hypothetical protein